MIALCLQHHEQADVGTFTIEQLRDLKTARPQDVPAGRFNWMRDELIGFIGGNFYVDVAVAVQVGRHRVVWFNRDDDNRLLLNLYLPSMSGENRLQMEDNFWLETGSPVDLECPPSGGRVRASYEMAITSPSGFVKSPHPMSSLSGIRRMRLATRFSPSTCANTQATR